MEKFTKIQKFDKIGCSQNKAGQMLAFSLLHINILLKSFNIVFTI